MNQFQMENQERFNLPFDCSIVKSSLLKIWFLFHGGVNIGK